MGTKKINGAMDRTRRIFVTTIALAVLAVIVGRLLQLESELRQYRTDAQSQLSRLQSQVGNVTSTTVSEVAALPVEAKPSEATLTPPIAATAPASSATVTPSPLPTATATGTPTSLPMATLPPKLPPTITATDTPTAVPDTPAGTVLEVGQSWWQGGLELQLTEARIGQESWVVGEWWGVYITLFLTNHKLNDIAIEYNLGKALRANDNNGRPLQISFANAAPGHDLWTHNMILRNGKSIPLWSGSEDWFPPSALVYAEVTDPGLTEVTVICSLYDIRNARWRIPIPH